ncbi:hypothetical protein Poly41_56140 [Novipirellula artificiosorum]|uniref:Uncharacterized protein n=1 Tax=Novipirellula artificiosorum TaxID=2528016 RepID=A0A5C6DBR1_9BACT|nr:hypothetical protein Poly41_56140 [Novipirellula artificiosorum]
MLKRLVAKNLSASRSVKARLGIWEGKSEGLVLDSK